MFIILNYSLRKFNLIDTLYFIQTSKCMMREKKNYNQGDSHQMRDDDAMTKRHCSLDWSHKLKCKPKTSLRSMVEGQGMLPPRFTYNNTPTILSHGHQLINTIHVIIVTPNKSRYFNNHGDQPTTTRKKMSKNMLCTWRGYGKCYNMGPSIPCSSTLLPY